MSCQKAPSFLLSRPPTTPVTLLDADWLPLAMHSNGRRFFFSFLPARYVQCLVNATSRGADVSIQFLFFFSRTSKGKQLVLYATKELATIAPQFPGRMTNVSLIFALRHKSSSS